MQASLEQILETKQVWQGSQEGYMDAQQSYSSGYQQLDLELPNAGWPKGALTEILTDQQGIGELRLLLPLLADQTRQGRWVAFIGAPYIPYAPSLAAYGVDLSRLLLVHPRADRDCLWATEQALRMGTCSTVISWPGQLEDRWLRRLQLAAEEGDTVGVLMRPAKYSTQPSPAAVRLNVSKNQHEDLSVHIIKRRHAWPRDAFPLSHEQLVDESAFSLAATGGL